jgi:phosphate:Na+ symporter
LDVLQAAGGLGLFLLGMLIMTDGLRGLAGDALQRILRRLTRSPASGAAAGALVTAVVQSSSATTVSAVGFAGAGLLTFAEALGIVFGATLGTTVTGWMVALLGFKVKLGMVMPLAILAGVLLQLLGRGRTASAGHALAGFGLLFLGIEGLRGGMVGLEQFVTPSSFPPDTYLGRLQLVALGIVITLLTQSSSAGVAASLAALSAGAISFPLAAAMVIGMNVGTTVTAALATIGASLPGRRTGWAHVIYNVITGTLAFAILPLFVIVLEIISPGFVARQPEIALVGFHTFFNGLGVVGVLPLTHAFAGFVERLVPEKPAPFTKRLDRRLLGEPAVALRAVAPTLDELTHKSFGLLSEQLDPAGAPDQSETRGLIVLALDAVKRWLARIETPQLGSDAEARTVAALHIVDQLQRLLDRTAQSERVAKVRSTGELSAIARELRDALAPGAVLASHLGTLAGRLSSEQREYRAKVLTRAGADEIDYNDALGRLDAYRWLERVVHHCWRAMHHLEQLAREARPLPEVEPPEPD